MGRVAWVTVWTDGLASVDVQTSRTSQRGPSGTSLEHVLAWSAEQTEEIVVADRGWDDVRYSAGPKAVDGFPTWPPAGYVAPEVPAAPTMSAAAWSVEIRGKARRSDHEALAAALLRAEPRAHREPDDRDVVVTVPLAAMTELEADAAAQRVDRDIWKRVRKDPAVTCRWRPVAETVRPAGPVEYDGPIVAYLEQFAYEDPSVDSFMVRLSSDGDGRGVGDDRPHLQPYADALVWARERSDVVVVRVGDERFRPATDERPALPEPVPEERFDPPIPWTVALALHVGEGRPTALVDALRAAVDGDVVATTIEADEFANEPHQWTVTVTATVVAATSGDAAAALQSQVLGAVLPNPDGFLLSFDTIEPAG